MFIEMSLENIEDKNNKASCISKNSLELKMCQKKSIEIEFGSSFFAEKTSYQNFQRHKLYCS